MISYFMTGALTQAVIEVPKLAAIPILGDIVTAPAIRQIIEAIIPGGFAIFSFFCIT